MIALQLLLNGLVTGCALGMVAMSFSLVYSTTKIFHIAHAGIFTFAGYAAWTMVSWNVPEVVAFVATIILCALSGGAIQRYLYEPMARSQATPLVVLIASLGILAVIVNVIAAIFSANVLPYPVPWAPRTMSMVGLRLDYAQVATLVAGL